MKRLSNQAQAPGIRIACKSREFKHAWYGQITKFTECWRIFHTFRPNSGKLEKLHAIQKTKKIAYQLHEREPVMLKTPQVGVYETAKPLSGRKTHPVLVKFHGKDITGIPLKLSWRFEGKWFSSSKVWCFFMIWRSNIVLQNYAKNGPLLLELDPFNWHSFGGFFHDSPEVPHQPSKCEPLAGLQYQYHLGGKERSPAKPKHSTSFFLNPDFCGFDGFPFSKWVSRLDTVGIIRIVS